nr:immunoglobulin light chain junction region [Macaca mulatta]MPN65262.1 immunoglobulin light chain junction region [Macaca mulatta]MPN65454.1 immunoglobulin light chain junction region [Macaca mulatta]MPN65557.1 immunoglobulin light chain junction region [Macaca mulatta]MPN65572.1 immunoglobulin light chain junction region [Macaca mulatta]
CLLLYGGAVLF